MTDASSQGSNAAENLLEQQSLTEIEGIGKVKQQWLKSIGINNLSELAEAIAEEIETQLSAEGHTVHAGEVEQWITQAQELVVELGLLGVERSEPPTSERPELTTSISFSGKEAAAEEPEVHNAVIMSEESSESESPSSSAMSEEADEEGDSVDTVSITVTPVADWQTFSEFTVEFQSQQAEDDVRYRTRVRHLATEQEETWLGIEEKNLHSWLRSQVAEVIPSQTFTGEETTPDPNARITLDIENLFILQPPSASLAMELYQPNMMFPCPIKGNLPFSLVIQFTVQEQHVLATLKQEVSYSVECYARSLKGGEGISLGELPPTALAPQNAPYIVYLPTISLQKGIYRLQIFLSLQGMQALPSFIEVPVLQVT